MPAGCHGNGAGHCCWVAGQQCPFLEEHTVEGRRWVCALMRELGDWQTVHADVRYRTVVRVEWDRAGAVDCGDWTGPNRDGGGQAQCCFAEGVSL